MKSTTPMDMAGEISQAEFAAMVGVSEASVSTYVARGTLQRGACVAEWLEAYLRQLRAAAEDRGAGTPLGAERLRVITGQADKLAMQNAAIRAEYMDAELMAYVFAQIVDQVAAPFEEILRDLGEGGQFGRRFTGEPKAFLQERLGRVVTAVRGARLNADDISSENEAEAEPEQLALATADLSTADEGLDGP